MNIKILPLDRVAIDQAVIPLGAERQIVEAAIGKGSLAGTRTYYFGSNMAIDYDASGCVEFIEFLGGIDGELHPEIYGVPAFATDAEELAELLREKNGAEISDVENGHSLAFLNISVGVYREMTPGSVDEMIEEMKAHGIPTDGNEDVAAERRRANHWATIGIGIRGYYQRG